MKYAVKVNDGATHIVQAKTIIGALKATLESLEATGEHPLRDESLVVSITPIQAKARSSKPEQVVG